MGTEDPGTRRWALAEGEKILARGCVFHNYFLVLPRRHRGGAQDRGLEGWSTATRALLSSSPMPSLYPGRASSPEAGRWQLMPRACAIEPRCSSFSVRAEADAVGFKRSRSPGADSPRRDDARRIQSPLARRAGYQCCQHPRRRRGSNLSYSLRTSLTMAASPSTSRMTSVPRASRRCPRARAPQTTRHRFSMGAQAAREFGGGRRKDDGGFLSRRDLAGKAQQFHLDLLCTVRVLSSTTRSDSARTKRVSRRRTPAFTHSCLHTKSQRTLADITASIVSLSATTVHERGRPSIAASSPNISPAGRSRNDTSRPHSEKKVTSHLSPDDEEDVPAVVLIPEDDLMGAVTARLAAPRQPASASEGRSRSSSNPPEHRPSAPRSLT